jgi:Flp pilus assembly protein TadB
MGAKLGCAAIGVLAAAAMIALVASAGLALNPVLPLWAALTIAAGLWFLPDLALRREADNRRRVARATLSALANVIELDLAGGRGLTSAVELAAGITQGWLGAALRLALQDAARAGKPPGPALDTLGRRFGLDDLVDLAANITLSGSSGAAPRKSLSAKAAALRDAVRNDLKAEAATATESAAFPLGLLAFATLALTAWPFLARIAIPH